MGQPTKSWVPTYCSFSPCKILLKLHGLHDLCNLALGLTPLFHGVPRKGLGCSWNSGSPTLPHYYSGAVPGFILILSTIFLSGLSDTVEQGLQPTSLQRPWSLSGMRGTVELVKTGEGRH